MGVIKWVVGAVLAAGIGIAPAGSAPPQQPLYKDARQPVASRVEDLLARMTLEEKVAQLETIWEQKAKVQTPDGRFDPALASTNFPNGIGGFAHATEGFLIEAKRWLLAHETRPDEFVLQP